MIHPHQVANSKSEYRNPKQIRISKSPNPKQYAFRLGHLEFGFRLCFGFRYPDFGFSISADYDGKLRRGYRGRHDFLPPRAANRSRSSSSISSGEDTVWAISVRTSSP